MADIKKPHEFTVGKKADGTTVYMIDGSEVPDKTTWANLRQKNADVASQTMDEVDQEANAAMGNSEKSFDDIFKAKGGKVTSTKMSTHSKNPKHPNW